MIYKVFPAVLFLLFSFSTTKSAIAEKTSPKTEVLAKVETTISIDAKVEMVYNSLHSDKFALPKQASFTEALKGFYSLKEKGLVKKDILTLVDFSLPSSTKRLWVIDLSTNTILFHSLVAHGRNTGEDFASSFSNAAESYKSSLGFYATGEIYTGKHGMSLKLDGLEKGVNDNARNRGVVMHAADYVSASFVKNHSRLGRSQGCPALPAELTKDIISSIKNKSCLFIYHPSRSSKLTSQMVS